MKHVTFEEYEAAKAEIIGGVQYKERSSMENNVIYKTYTTERGTFYERNEGGRVEFWSDKHPESRIYDENERMTDAAPAEEADATTDSAEPTTPERVPGYGEMLSDKIRAETQDFSKLNEFEKFVLDRGFEFDTEAGLKAGYDRAWKARRGIMLTAEEFTAEARSMFTPEAEYKPLATTADVYDILSDLVEGKKLTPGDVFGYARHGWCLKHPEAIVAYQVDPYKDSPIHRKWAVNNCDTEISEERARVEVCEEWGFEASRVKIIGTPYYDATDWQFIRFDCAHMTWLWKNGSLYQVYA